jgi:ligand-binding sensor domain-containing protein/signal transduction histidine kinase
MFHLLARLTRSALRMAGRTPAASAWLMLAAVNASAGPENYLIDVWTAENGLPNSSVTAIARTPDGYLWVGTYNGLARFDGVHFVSFDPLTTPELANARVRRLFVDASGTLWVNTFDGSLTSVREGKFRLEWRGDGSADAWVWPVSLQTNRLAFLLQHTGEIILRDASAGLGTNWNKLQPPGFGSGELAVQDRDGTIWCRGRDQRLCRYDGRAFQIVSAEDGLPGQTINALVADPQGRVWVGTDQGLFRWDGARFANQNPTNGESKLNVASINFLQNGDCWVFDDGRVRLARGREWIREPAECQGIFTGRLERLGVQEDRDGGSWIYHYGEGLFHVRADGVTRKISSEEGFPGDRVDCFFVDQEGNLWAGVDRGGLVRLRERLLTVLQPGNDLAPKAAVSVAQDDAGSLWVGTFGGGLFRRTGQSWEQFVLAEGLQRGFVFSVFPGGKGRLWVSAGDEDLFLFSRGNFQAVTPPVHGVKSLLQAQDGRLWIGTKSGLMSWTDGGQRQFTPEDGVDRVDIRALAEDIQGRIWAGGGNGTLYCIVSNRGTAFRSEGALASQPIWSLLPDQDGSLWVGTFRGGLLRFQAGHFVRFTSKHGLPDDVICQLLNDDAGWLWAGTSRGIFRVAKSELMTFAEGRAKFINCTAYGHLDGLPSLECSGSYQPACWRSSDGQLFFTTLKGVVAVHPKEMAPNRMAPPVYFEQAVVDGVEQPFGRKVIRTAPGRESIMATLELPPGQRQLELRYTGLSLASPDRVRFRYRMQGLNRDWVEAGTRRTVQYSFLRPGRYTLQVIACNSDGVWNMQGASLLLTVQPYFYETGWFVALCAFSAMVVVAITVRQVVVRKMRRELEVMERQRAVERDRTRIARDIHDDLGAGLTHISLLSELARRTPAKEAESQLRQISEMARELTRGMDEIVWAVDPRNDTLDGLMDYLCKFAQEYLSVAGIRCRLELPAQMPPWTLRPEVRHNLFLAIKEVLNNIVKHAGATEVSLELALGVNAFTLTLKDNGRGLAAEKAGAGQRSPGRISSGHGMGNLEKRLAAIHGSCAVSSRPELGTQIALTVSLAAPHPKW